MVGRLAFALPPPQVKNLVSNPNKATKKTKLYDECTVSYQMLELIFTNQVFRILEQWSGILYHWIVEMQKHHLCSKLYWNATFYPVTRSRTPIMIYVILDSYLITMTLMFLMILEILKVMILTVNFIILRTILKEIKWILNARMWKVVSASIQMLTNFSTKEFRTRGFDWIVWSRHHRDYWNQI